MNPVHIIAWALIAAFVWFVILRPCFAFASRLWLHRQTRDVLPAKYQTWISPGGQRFYINDVTSYGVVVSADPNNLGGVCYNFDGWRAMIRGHKLALIS